MVWGFLFAGFAALGVDAALASDREFNFNTAVLAFILVVAAVSGSMAAADDVDAFQLADDRTKEVSLGDDHAHLRAAAAYSTRTNANISADWIARETFILYGAPHSEVSVKSGHVTSETDLLLIRNGWTENVIKMTVGPNLRLQNVYFSEAAVDRTSQIENKVYTSGDVTVLYDVRRKFFHPPSNGTR
jgi:hypothetical protein